MSSEKWIYTIFINVGGTIFQTRMSTLRKIPDSRLGNLSPASPEYNPETDEYFFDHSPALFNEILDLYRTDELHVPNHCCGAVLQRELEYWKIPKHMISECCMHSYHRFVNDRTTIDIIRRSFEEDITDYDPKQYRNNNFMKLARAVWLTLDQPKSSTFAKIFNIFYLVVVVISILVFLLSYQPTCRKEIMSYNYLLHMKNTSNINLFKNVDLKNAKEVMFLTTVADDILRDIDTFCISFFSLELLLHFLSSPRKLKFFTGILNILDIYLVVAMWTTFAIERTIEKSVTNEDLMTFYTILKSTLALRLLRFFRLMKQYSALKILFMSLKASLKELLLLLIIVILASVLFASFVYFAEFKEKDEFPTIIDSMWWAMVTMTTVGYGDMVPSSIGGKLVGVICAASGILIIAMPIAIVASNFSDYYQKNSERRLRKHFKNKKRRKKSCCVWGDSKKIDTYSNSQPLPKILNPKKKEGRGKNRDLKSNGSTSLQPSTSSTQTPQKTNGIWHGAPEL